MNNRNLIQEITEDAQYQHERVMALLRHCAIAPAVSCMSWMDRGLGGYFDYWDVVLNIRTSSGWASHLLFRELCSVATCDAVPCRGRGQPEDCLECEEDA